MRRTHAKTGCKCALRVVRDAYFLDVRRCQFRAALTFTAIVSALKDHIAHVIEMGAKKQMVWIDARRIVAPMQDVQSRWDWSAHKLPRCAMGFPAAELSIPVAVQDVCPRPAYERIGKAPETLSHADPKRLPGRMQDNPNVACAGFRTKALWENRPARKRLSTSLARPGSLGNSHVTSTRSLVRAVTMLITPWRPVHYSTGVSYGYC